MTKKKAEKKVSAISKTKNNPDPKPEKKQPIKITEVIKVPREKIYLLTEGRKNRLKELMGEIPTKYTIEMWNIIDKLPLWQPNTESKK